MKSISWIISTKLKIKEMRKPSMQHLMANLSLGHHPISVRTLLLKIILRSSKNLKMNAFNNINLVSKNTFIV